MISLSVKDKERKYDKMIIEHTKSEAMFLRNIYQQIINNRKLDDDEIAFLQAQQKVIDDKMEYKKLTATSPEMLAEGSPHITLIGIEDDDQ